MCCCSRGRGILTTPYWVWTPLVTFYIYRYIHDKICGWWKHMYTLKKNVGNQEPRDFIVGLAPHTRTHRCCISVAWRGNTSEMYWIEDCLCHLNGFWKIYKFEQIFNIPRITSVTYYVHDKILKIIHRYVAFCYSNESVTAAFYPTSFFKYQLFFSAKRLCMWKKYSWAQGIIIQRWLFCIRH